MPGAGNPPAWFQALVRSQRGGPDPTRGVRQRSQVLGRQPTTLSLDQIVVPPRRRDGSRSGASSERPEAPEAVLQRLRDKGLTDAQAAKVAEGDKDTFSPLSPGDWLSGGGNVLKGVLDKLDIPRAYALSGAEELIEASAQNSLLNLIPGLNFVPPEETDRFKQSGVSWQDFVRNAGNRIGFADILEADPRTEDMPGWAKATSGFVFDVASDPLNYFGVGLADDSSKVIRAFSSKEAVTALGEEGAAKAAQKVVKKGVNALDEKELAAVAKHVKNPGGGLYTRVPGTGPVGRTLKLDRAIAKLGGEAVEDIPRYVSLAPKGTKVGDFASGVARNVRRPLNTVLDVANLGGRGLAGGMPTLRNALRKGTPDEAVRAFWTLTKEPEARYLSQAFERELAGELGGLITKAKAAGANGQDLWHAVGGDVDAANRVGDSSLVNEFISFFNRAKDLANERAGEDFIKGVENYTPRIWTDKTRAEVFGGRSQGGTGGIRSVAKGRKYQPGDTLLGQELLDPVASGRSVEQQIEDILTEKGYDNWFKEDAFEAFPEYVKLLSSQVQTQYLGTELKKLGIGKPFARPAAEAVKRGKVIESDVAEARKIVDDLGTAATRESSSVNEWGNPVWVAKAAAVATEKEPVLKKGLDATFKQFGYNTQLPVDIVGALQDIGKMSDPSAFPTVIKLHNKLLKMWKQSALLSPGYHMRNSFGGVWMNWLGDVDEGRYSQIRKLLKAEKNGTLDSLKIEPELKQGFEEAKRLGLFRTGQTAQEIELGAPSRLAALNIFRRSHNLGARVENHLRGAMFLDEFAKTGGNATEAFAKTLKYHFDYEDLSKAEAKIRQYAVPFYTWTRRSIPLVLEHVVRSPGKINRYFQLKDNVERLSEEEGIVPQYFQNNWAIRLPWHTGQSQMYLMPDLPLLSLADVSDPGQLVGQVSPIIKTPYEWAAGKQVWKGIPLTDDPAPIPPVVAAIPGVVPALRGLGRIRTDAEGNQVMSEKDVYFLQQFLPQLGQARRLFPHEDRYQDRRMTSWLSYIFGVGARANTEHEQGNEIWRRYYSYDADIQRTQGLGFDPDTAREMAFDTAA